jgi:hypothetical protein
LVSYREEAEETRELARLGVFDPMVHPTLLVLEYTVVQRKPNLVINLQQLRVRNIQGTFREHSAEGAQARHQIAAAQGKEHSWNAQGTCRERSGNIQGTLREHSAPDITAICSLDIRLSTLDPRYPIPDS